MEMLVPLRNPARMERPDLVRIVHRARPDLHDPRRRAAFRRLNDGYRTIKLHLTYACNLRCHNCYNEAERKGLRRAEIFGLLDQLRGRPARLDLLGGEPTLHPDIEEIIRYAKAEVGVDSVFLYTNATRVDDAFAERLRGAGLDTALVSLHSPEPTAHEAMTASAGSFEATVKGLDALNRAGVRAYTFTVVSATNVDRLEEMKAFSEARGAGAIFFPYIPQREDDPLIVADPEALRRALTFIIRSSYVYRAALKRSLADGAKLCRAFTQTVTVLADGTVTPCPFLHLPLGNVREKPLYDILEESATNAGLADMLAVPDECGTCTIRGVCGGGCKAGRFTVHGDLDRRDLYCHHGPHTEPVSIGALPECLPYLY